MKRFLVFVIICIVTLSMGLTTWYLLRDEEVLIVEASNFEVNKGDYFTVEYQFFNKKSEIEFTSLHPDKVEYNPVGSIYDEITGRGIASFEAASGGKAVVEITSNKPDFEKITMQIDVGDGTANAPFYIFSVEQLAEVGRQAYNESLEPIDNVKTLDKHYILKADLDLSALLNLSQEYIDKYQIEAPIYEDAYWLPLGNNKTEGYSGTFNFNEHTIYNLNIDSDAFDEALNIDEAGLFAKLEDGAVIKNLNLNTVNIFGYYDYVGAIAGINYGIIERSTVTLANISNLEVGGVAGGVVGRQELDTAFTPKISMVSVNATINTTSVAGGIIGQNYGGIVTNSYADAILVAPFNATVGGIVGYNAYETVNSVDYKSVVKDCYFLGLVSDTTTIRGAIIGQNVNEDDVLQFNTIKGNYYTSEVTGEINAIGNIDNATLDTDRYGAYNKTGEELKVENTFYSYENRQNVDVYWAFNRVWTFDTEVNSGYPVLIMDGIPLRDDTDINDGVSITTVADLINMDLNSHYILRANINLDAIADWTPIGTSEDKFNGTLEADTYLNASDELVYYYIENLNITSDRESNGLFGYIGSGTVENITIYEPNISAGQNVGAIAGTSAGRIENCNVMYEEDSLKNNLIIGSSSLGSVRVGGLVGSSSGNILRSTNEVRVEGQSSGSSVTYIGGIVGVSSQQMYNVFSTASVNSTGNHSVYIGGIAGENRDIIDKSYFLGNITTSTTSSNAIAGGLVGNLTTEHGLIDESFVEGGEYQGYAVGGLVGEVNGDSNVSECYIFDVNITGNLIGGLAYMVKYGCISNSYSEANLLGLNSSSEKGGFAYWIAYTDSGSGLIDKCFSATTFNEDGANYAETAAPVRTAGFLVIRQAGFIKDSIYTARSQVLIKQNFVSLFNSEFAIPKNEREIEVSDSHALGGDGKNFSKFLENGFSSTLWDFTIDQYPQLRQVVKIAEETEVIIEEEPDDTDETE
jgi:hypothetical protein